MSKLEPRLTLQIDCDIWQAHTLMGIWEGLDTESKYWDMAADNVLDALGDICSRVREGMGDGDFDMLDDETVQTLREFVDVFFRHYQRLNNHDQA